MALAVRVAVESVIVSEDAESTMDAMTRSMVHNRRMNKLNAHIFC